MPMTVALADAPQEPQSLRQPTGLRLSTPVRASHQPGEKARRVQIELIGGTAQLHEEVRKSAISIRSVHEPCLSARDSAGIPQDVVRGRSWPTSANPVSRSEPAISAPDNHHQRHPGSSSCTTTSDPRRSPKPPDSRVDPGVLALSEGLAAINISTPSSLAPRARS